MIKLADKLNLINEPQTIAMAKAARQLAASGADVINLSLGEPDFDTPEHIKLAAINAINENFTHYTPVAGIPELKEAVCHKLNRDNNLTYNTENIVVSTGAKHSLMNAVMAIVNKGDEVIIPTPYWVSYSEMVKLNEAIPVFIHTTVNDNYKINPEMLKKAITPKTKLFIFSSPCNPTGSFYNMAELEQLVNVFLENPNIYIISDEIYEYINYTGAHFSIAQFSDLKDRVIVINGLSKGFAMTGWRLGYMAANKEIASACEKIQAQFTSATCSITQKAAVAALTGSLEPTLNMTKEFLKRKKLVQTALQQIPNILCNNPEGAFYFFPDISYYLNRTYNGKTISTSSDLCMYLLNEAHVSLVTGEAFGAPECIRISYAASENKLQKACNRLKTALAKLV
ncbi:MAG: pyridoxal phosphate-dependent aminotransferase [Bacteroidia bacterium]